VRCSKGRTLAAGRPDRVHQRLQELGVVHAGGREQHRQGPALPIDEQVVLAAGLAALDGVRAGVLAAVLGPHADAVQAGARPVQGVQIPELV
jgi:hypothetical protein